MLAHLVERDIRIVEVRSSSLLHSTTTIEKEETRTLRYESPEFKKTVTSGGLFV